MSVVLEGKIKMNEKENPRDMSLVVSESKIWFLLPKDIMEWTKGGNLAWHDWSQLFSSHEVKGIRHK